MGHSFHSMSPASSRLPTGTSRAATRTLAMRGVSTAAEAVAVGSPPELPMARTTSARAMAATAAMPMTAMRAGFILSVSEEARRNRNPTPLPLTNMQGAG